MAVLRMTPHCDLHLALNTPGTNSVSFRVHAYLDTTPFTLSPLDTPGEWTAQILAPHNAVGGRLQSFVTVDFNARTITANALGTNLIVLHHSAGGENDYLVIRVQVHDRMLAWWFGDASLSVSLDASFANAQPSIYAMFSDDAAIGTDRVGDITGHGFVMLTPSVPGVFAIDNSDNAGRLRGTVTGSAALNGSFLGMNGSVAVRVVDYAQTRDILVPVRAGDLANAPQRHNILFLSEGFTAAEEASFDRIVTEVTDELLTKPRHQPYGALAESFNIFKAFVPSQQALVTCGFRVTEQAVGPFGKGGPIPLEFTVGTDATKYTVAELVTRVGLPRRGENRNRSQLVALWKSQGLHDFDETRIDDDLVTAWKASHGEVYVESRDTFFGMILGGRQADHGSTAAAPLTNPAADDNSDAMKALVRRAYEFYELALPSRTITFDPRRHAPERMLRGNASPTSTFMQFLAGLRGKAAPHQALGPEWVPDTHFKRSRGLIAVILNDTMHGGTNINDNTVTANTINSDITLDARAVANADPNIKVVRRHVPTNIAPDLSGVVNTIAHEFGHSFNLGDEYEDFPEPPGFASEQLNPADTVKNFFDTNDNLASMEAVFLDPQYIANASRTIDADKIKWTKLPRIKLSSRLTAAVQVNAGKLEVPIPPADAAAWEPVRVSGEEVHLRRIVIEPNGRQLPLSSADADHLTGLTISSIDAAGGKLVLSGGSLVPPPTFLEGSVVFLPHRTGGVVQTIIEPKVMAELVSSRKPLNSDIDKPEHTRQVNKGADFPRDVPDFKAPCQSSRLLGAFEGGGMFSGLVYRPAGSCKMRTSEGADEHGEFCHVCKWLITNRVDPGKHHVIDAKFYPKAKKND